jgi:hypothetical protein
MWKRTLREAVAVGVSVGYLLVDGPEKRRNEIVKAWCTHHDMHHTVDLLVEKHRMDTWDVRLDMAPCGVPLTDKQMTAIASLCESYAGDRRARRAVAPTYMTVRVFGSEYAEELARKILQVLKS